MSRCHMETCHFWTGDGCACAVMDIEPEIEDGDDR